MRSLGFAMVAWVGFASGLEAQPQIVHTGLECVTPGRFAVVLSGISPEQEIQTAKVYFRSSFFPDFYYVEMALEEGRFVGILPQPAPETERIIYYVEAIDTVFNSTRSREFDPLVEECDDDPAAAYFAGEDPGIVVGATTGGASPLPPGFSAVGIAGTITAAGVSSGIGGGVGVGTAVAAAAGAAGVAGAVVAITPESPEPTTSVTVAGPPPPASPPPAASTVSPEPPAPPPAPTTTVPAATTTTSSVPGGTTTTTVGTGTTTTTVVVSTTTSTTSTSTTTTTAPPLSASCFTVQVVGECRVRLDASCVSPPVDRYEWVLDVNDRWQRVDIPNGAVTFTHTFSNCGEDDASIRFRLVVHRGTASASSEKSIVVPGEDLTAPPAPAGDLRFTTQLSFPSSGRGRVLLNGNFVRSVEANAPLTVQTVAREGTNRITGVVASSGGEPGTWRFDLGGETRVVDGSVRVVQGQVVSVEPAAVTFRVTGENGERVELTFERTP